MRALLLVALLVGPAFGNDLCQTPPPPGPGLPPDGHGLVHIMEAGFYSFHGAVVNRTPGARYYLAGSWGTVAAFNSALEWTLPSGRREPIPTTSLYPPMRPTP